MRQRRAAVGGAYAARGHYFMRVTVAAGVRHAEALPWVTAEQWVTHGTGEPCPCVACIRARHVQELVNRLRDAGLNDRVTETIEQCAGSASLTSVELEVFELTSKRTAARPRFVGRDEEERSYVRWLEERIDALENAVFGRRVL